VARSEIPELLPYLDTPQSTVVDDGGDPRVERRSSTVGGTLPMLSSPRMRLDFAGLVGTVTAIVAK
jgi:hypothetical protein